VSACGRVYPGSEPEADRCRVDGGRIDAGAAHQRLQPGTLGRGERSQPSRREGAILVQEGHDVCDRRERDEIEVSSDRGVVGTEQHFAELVHDASATELRKRVLGRPGGDDRAVRQCRAGPVVVCDDDVEPTQFRLGDLLDRCDAAVDREDEPVPVVGEAPERVARDAVALLEPARKMAADVGAELAQEQRRERGRADSVDVVVAVHADSLAFLDGLVNPLDRDGHVAEEQRIVPGKLGFEEPPRCCGIAIATAHEHRSGDLRHVQLERQRPRSTMVQGGDRPGARHGK
jgi:hypothetical protein